MLTRLLILHALSPVHAGTGQSVGAIDLAIARDRATDHPYIPGSSIKGSLRGLSRDLGRGDTKQVFGPETEDASDHAGAVAVGDANLLLLPVRSIVGTFAWVTSPFLLARFARDAREAGLTPPALSGIPLVSECRVCGDHARIVMTRGEERRVVFEDLDLVPTRSTALPWADFIGGLIFEGDETWLGYLRQKLCIVHDDVMTFMARHGVDVTARIALEPDSKTVRDGGLWYEENLPAETVMSALLVASPPRKAKLGARDALKAIDELTEGTVQLGGNATVGRGRCALTVVGGEEGR